MNKLVYAIVGVATAIMVFATASVIASTPNTTVTGRCFDNSQYQLVLTRSGSKVVSQLTVQPTVKNATWIVNYAYTPSNKVDYQIVKSDKRGKLVAKAVYYTAQKTGVLIFTDNSGVMYCAIYGEI